MTITLPAHRRQADDLQSLLDGRRASSRAAAEDLAPLVALATALAPVEHRPAPDFRVALRDRLVAAAADRAPAPAGPAPRRRRPAPSRLRQAVAAVAVASVVGGVGAAAASTRALPGDPLYGLKRQVEAVQLSLARGDLSQGRELLEQADARLSEAERMAAGEHGAEPATQARIGQSLEDMDAAVTRGTAELQQAYRATGDPEALLLLDRFVTDQRERLDDLLALLSPDLREQARALSDELGRIAARAEAVLGAASAREALIADGDGWAVSRQVDAAARAAGTATGGGPAAGGAAAGGAVNDVLDAAGGVTGDGAGGSGSAGGGGGGGGSTIGGVVGGVGGVVGGVTPGATSSSGGLGTVLPSALPTISAAPLPTSSPLVTDPVGTVTSAVPLPSTSLVPLPSVSACVPIPPLTAC
jgi:Domain of unknown function (DUF5667)